MLFTAVALVVPCVTLNEALRTRSVVDTTRTFPFALPVYTYCPRRSKEATMFRSDCYNKKFNYINNMFEFLKFCQVRTVSSWQKDETHVSFPPLSVLIPYLLKSKATPPPPPNKKPLPKENVFI
jgi:hypothetical protein